MRRSTHNAGFTAIEMVSAITILMLIMAAVASIFGKSNDLWARSGGSDRLTRSTRRALDLMVRDMRHAVVEEGLPFVLQKSGTNALYSLDQSDLVLVTHRDDGDPTNRAVNVVWYGLREVEAGFDDGPARVDLLRGVHVITNVYDPAPSDNIYWLSNAVDAVVFEDAGVLVENVTLFRLEVTRPDGELASFYDAHLAEDVGVGALGEASAVSDARRAVEGRLPRRVDIVIEAVDPRIAWQLTTLGEAEQAELIDRKAVRLTAAVAFVTGYSAERGR